MPDVKDVYRDAFSDYVNDLEPKRQSRDDSAQEKAKQPAETTREDVSKNAPDKAAAQEPPKQPADTAQSANASSHAQSSEQPIPTDMAACETLLKSVFNNSFDMVIQAFDTGADKALILFVDGMVNKDLIDRDIMYPLKADAFDGNVPLAIKSAYLESSDLSYIVQQVLGGFVAVFYTGSATAYLVEFRGWQQRPVSEPDAEKAVRGPKEGFTENIRVNTALIRRKIKNPNLIIESVASTGEQTHTEIELVYIKDIVNQDVLARVKKRLAKIDVGSILESGYVEQYISGNRLAPVSGIGVTQKPDILAARILEGRLGLLVDGTPHALTIPELFIENIQTAEDYYERPVYGTVIRLYRVIGFVITTILPGFTIAVLTFDQEMIPGIFLATIIKSMLKTPMSVSAEIFVMMVMFELLREAGIRLPQAVGSAITIVGSLIIGQAATSAGIVSETAVIIVALTAVTSFILPNLVAFTLQYRFFFWLMGSTMGLIGVSFALFIMMTQIISTTSFGIPVLSAFDKNERKDSFVRFPWQSMKYRPASIAKNNRKRSDM